LTLLPDSAAVQFWGGKVPSLHSFVLFALVSAQVLWGEEQTGEFAMPYAMLFGNTRGDKARQAKRFKALCGQVVELYNATSGQKAQVRYSPVLSAPDLIRKMHQHKCVVMQDPSIGKGYTSLAFSITGETEKEIRQAMVDGSLDAALAEWVEKRGLPKDEIEIQWR
jgi:hypothetical protein